MTDPRRRSEDSPVFAALKAATVKRLLVNIRRYRAALAKRQPDAQNHFIHKHISILRDAYTAGHQLGVMHYWGEVSNAKAPKLPIDDQLLMKRLAFYAPSVAKMATELHQEAQQLAEGDDPMAARVKLQADLSWTGQEDGYWRAGVNDPANPYGYVYWLLEPAAQHCSDCPDIAARSPFGPPGSGRNELRQTPGDGNTMCGASCKCHLAYGPPDNETDATDWGPFIPEDADLQQLWPEAFPPLVFSPTAEYLTDAQKEALDLFRHGYEQWEIYRQQLPELPEMFDPNSAKYEKARIGWEHYTEKQQQALRIIFQALRDWQDAGGGDVQRQLSETVRFYDPNQPRDPHSGKWVNTGASHQHASTAKRGGAGGTEATHADVPAHPGVIGIHGKVAGYRIHKAVPRGYFVHEVDQYGGEHFIGAAKDADHVNAIIGARGAAGKFEGVNAGGRSLTVAPHVPTTSDHLKTDLHGQAMPFTRGEADAARATKTPLPFEQLGINNTGTARINGRDYYIKELRDRNDPSKTFYGMSAAEQGANEAATVAGMKALGLGDHAPAESYDLVGSHGGHYNVISAERGTDASDLQTTFAVADHVPNATIQHLRLAEFVLGMSDRHDANVLYDEHTNHLREIDFGMGFHLRPTAVAHSFTAGVWNLQYQMQHGHIPHSNDLVYDAHIVKSVLGRRSAVEQAISHFGLTAEQRHMVSERYDLLQRWADRGQVTEEDLLGGIQP